jgi:hypothetical protein
MRKLPGVESVISSLPSTILLLCHTTTYDRTVGAARSHRADGVYHVGRTASGGVSLPQICSWPHIFFDSFTNSLAARR